MRIVTICIWSVIRSYCIIKSSLTHNRGICPKNLLTIVNKMLLAFCLFQSFYYFLGQKTKDKTHLILQIVGHTVSLNTSMAKSWCIFVFCVDLFNLFNKDTWTICLLKPRKYLFYIQERSTNLFILRLILFCKILTFCKPNIGIRVVYIL